MNVSIGLDIGATQTRVATFTDGTQEATSVYPHYPLVQETQGVIEQDQELIFQGVCTVIKGIVRQLPSDTAIQFASFSSAMHNLILLDEEKTPLSRTIIWADNRAADEAEKPRYTTLGKEFYRQTGIPIHPMTPLNKIKWLRNSQPELLKKTACSVGIKGYIFYRLSGELVSDYGTVSETGYFNIHEFQWAEEMLDYLDIRIEQSPQVFPSIYQITGLPSETTAKLGLPNDISFVLGGADSPLSNLGLGAFGDTIAALTVGTSGVLRFITTQPQFHPGIEAFCYVLDQEHWVVGGVTSSGAGIFDWAGHTFLQEVVQSTKEKGENPYDTLLSAITFVPAGVNGLIFHPYLLGEQAPLRDADAFDSFTGLQRQHVEKEMMEAILEGICLNLYRVSKGVCQEDRLTGIRATDGFTQPPIFRQMMASALGCPLVFPTITGASALGTVILGWRNIGKTQSISEAQELIELKEQVGIQENDHKKYQKIYPLFVSAQKHLAQTYQQFTQLREELIDSERRLALWIKKQSEGRSQVSDFIVLFIENLLLF